MEYGIRQLRRAWLGPEDVLNTLEAEDLLAALQAGGVNRKLKYALFSVQFRYSLAGQCKGFNGLSGCLVGLR